MSNEKLSYEDIKLKYYADLCGIAYSDKETAAEGYRSLGYEILDYVSKAGTQMFRLSGGIYIFRGTDEGKDWWTNLVTHRLNKGGTHVHLGFWWGYRRVRDHIKDDAVLFLGHSLGGALAQLALIDYPNASAITFGAPMVGDAVLGKHHRVVNGNDIVARTPGGALGFKHFGNLTYLAKDGTICGQVKKWDWIRFGGIKDHSLIKYREKL
jgi:hypothetical protein